ncbi:MAG: hypothetical protein M1828_006500 [Chrysothrix sp. TS-e1954]|nr:MAG: hypothetical protein M1828_006500 [Chrysothrix sp. TS-e1954]
MAQTTAKDSYGAYGPKLQPKHPNRICRINGYDEDALTYYPIVIIGAGESGIAMGCQLKEVLGFDQFRIFDRQAGAGGTWWINRYPGVACDVPALFYSFSFAPNYKWSSFHPPGPEIVKYLNDTAADYGIADKIQCNTDIEGCNWVESDKCWEVHLRHMTPGSGDLSVKERKKKMEREGESSVFTGRETVRAKIVVSCVGGLVEPNDFPQDIPGRENFKGKVFHSARWDYSVDFNDKNVVVVGTGCSAAQFVPRLTKAPFNAKSVTQLMRSPPWVEPRPDPPGGEKGWADWSPTILSTVPGLGYSLRFLLFIGAEWTGYTIFGMDDFHKKWRAVVSSSYATQADEEEVQDVCADFVARQKEKDLKQHMQKLVPSKYHEILTPDYGVGCKRRIFDATWLKGLQNPNVDLTTQPLKSVTADSVILGPGQTYPPSGPIAASDEHEVPADVVVLANGFATEKWLHPLEIKGRGDKGMVDEMEARGGPQAYQGTAMDGYPNFFMIFGPNTATGHSSVILASENMVQYSLKFIKKILDGDAETVEVKREAEEAYTADVQKACSNSVINSGGCNNWYVNDGWNGTVYPYTQIWFGLRCYFPNWNDWNIALTRKGLLKQRFWRTLRLVIGTMAIVGAYQARQSGQGLGYFRGLMTRALDRIRA